VDIMTKEDAAKILHGNEYGNVGSKELFAAMNEARLVAVFGASDDLAEFCGAIDDEIGCYNGGDIFVTPAGLLTNECDNDDCPHYQRLEKTAVKIEAVWCETDDLSWSYKTEIPHVTFDIVEDGEVYCRGIVFSLDDLK
jgi:hypothetical protein